MKITHLKFTDHHANPIIRPPFPEWIIADPFVLTPNLTPNGLWYLFAHTLIGLRFYTSTNGLNWSKPSSPLVFFGYRPFIFIEKNVYYLLYEKINNPLRFPYYDSHIEMRTSTDLSHWQSPVTLLSPTLTWHKTRNAHGNIGNPSLIKIKNSYHLYYSAGLTYFSDTKFCEPQSVGLATSLRITGPYIPQEKPLNLPHIYKQPTFISNLRAFRLGSLLTSLQTHFHRHPSGKSTSSLHLATSTNGQSWKVISPAITTTHLPWKKSHVYVGDLKRFKDKLFVYYNGRSSWLFGSESIGLAFAKSP